MSRSFYLLWTSYLVTQTGNWLYMIALPLLIYELTGSAFHMAFMYGVEFLPWILFSLFGGLIADTFNKKQVLVVSNVFSALLVAGLAMVLSWETVPLALIYLVVFCLASINPLVHPTFNSIIPRLVDREHLVKANSAIQMIENTITLLGPMVGGSIIAFIGGQHALWIDAGTFALAVLLLALIPYQHQPNANRSRKPKIAESLRQGIQFTFQHKVILYGSLLFFFTNLAINAFHSNYMYHLAENLKLDSRLIGITIGLQGIGPILGALVGPSINKRFRPGTIILVSTILAGVATLFLLGATTFWQVALVQAVALAFGNINVITYFSLRQKLVPAELLGRVVSVTRMISFASIPLSAFLAGTAVSNGVSVYTIIFCGALLRVVVGVAGFFTPLGAKDYEAYSGKSDVIASR